MKTWRTLTVSLLFLATTARAADVDLTAPLQRRNELFLATQAVRPYLYDDKVLDRVAAWLHHDKIRPYVADCQFHMKAFFRSEKILGPLCYLLRQSDPARRRTALAFVGRYVLEVEAATVELADDPRYGASDRGKARDLARLFTKANKDGVESCLQHAMTVNYPDDGSLPFTPFSKVAQCFHGLPKVGGSPFFAVNLVKEFPHHPGHAISETGWIPGNRVEFNTFNDTTPELADKLAAKHSQMKDHYPLTGAGSVEAFKAKNWNEVFTPAEGFWKLEDHPVWTETKGVFPAMLKAVKEARESIFIDIFFLGSSMGAAFAKQLVEKAESGVKVFILRDNVNHFGHQAEMLPVFNYLRAYSEKNPDKLVVAKSYIKAHRSGLPKMLDQVVNDEFLQRSGLQDHLSLYGRATSDHSKVFVIDGKSKAPVALVGSKNLTDASGALTYDDVTRIEGPAAAVVLDDYYFDMVYALRDEMDETLLRHLASKGWSKASFQSGQSKAEMIANILRPFDLLQRDASMRPKAGVTVNVPEVGSARLRTGYNNVDSTRTNCVDEVVQMIRHAQRSIYIRDQYLWDRRVVLALVRAKQANPSLDVKAVLEPLSRFTPPGMPNLLYLDVLKAFGVEVRWKKLIEPSGNIHSEYHHKSISADGQSLIAGSANKDQTTMYGSFREQQFDVFDSAAAQAHDAALMEHWSDDESTPFSGFDFPVPGGLRGPDGKPLDSNQFIGLLRNVVSVLFDAQTL